MKYDDIWRHTQHTFQDIFPPRLRSFSISFFWQNSSRNCKLTKIKFKSLRLKINLSKKHWWNNKRKKNWWVKKMKHFVKIKYKLSNLEELTCSVALLSDVFITSLDFWRTWAHHFSSEFYLGHCASCLTLVGSFLWYFKIVLINKSDHHESLTHQLFIQQNPRIAEDPKWSTSTCNFQWRQDRSEYSEVCAIDEELHAGEQNFQECCIEAAWKSRLAGHQGFSECELNFPFKF